MAAAAEMRLLSLTDYQVDALHCATAAARMFS